MRLYKRRTKSGEWGKIWWISYYDHGTKNHERVSSRCTDQRAAESLGRRLERDSANSDGQAPPSATLAGALDTVIAEYEQRAKENRTSHETVEFYRKRAAQVLRMVAAGHVPALLHDLRARHLDALIDARRAEGTSPSTIAKDLIVIRIALKLAKRREDWSGDVDAIMPHRFSPEYRPRDRWLTHAEVWSLLGELRTDRAAWVAFAIATGANLSEASKARAEDVQRAFVHVRGTKTAGRDRRVPFVRRWQRLLLEAALSALPEKGQLFASWTKIDRDLKLAAVRAEIRPLSSNDLRRTFATWMRASGVALEVLAPMMGHADTRMLQVVYARLDADQLRDLALGVLTVYADPEDGAHQAHPSDLMSAPDSLDSGSDCRTRTCDPVINSPRSEAGIDAVSAEGVPLVLAGLRKAAAMLAAPDELDFWLAAGGEL